MLKIGKGSAALLMGLMLSLTLLASGAFAQETTTAQNAASAATRNALLAGDTQQGAEQMLPTSSTQSLGNSQPSNRCNGRYCRYNNYNRYNNRYRGYRRYGGLRCYRVRRGWRTVRVCNRY